MYLCQCVDVRINKSNKGGMQEKWENLLFLGEGIVDVS